MVSNGRLSIFDRSSPQRARLAKAQFRRRFRWSCVIAALAAAAAFNVLPLPPLLLIALTTVCLLLVPQTPVAMLVVLLVLSPLRALIATEASIVLALDIGQILLALYLGVWLAFQIIHHRPILRLSPEPVFLASFGLCAVFAFGVWTTDSIANWLSEWLKWVVIAIMIWHLSHTARCKWGWLVFAVLVSAVANAIVGLYIFFGGSGADHLVILGRFFRAFGTFGQPNPFGGFMGIALPLALMGSLSQLQQIVAGIRTGARIERRRILLLAGFCLGFSLILAALFASWSRGAWLGFAVSLIVMLVAWPRRLAKGMALAIVFAAMFAAIWSAGLLPRSMVNRLMTAATDLFTISDARGVAFDPTNYAVVERLAHWQTAINMAQEHPVFGVGLGNYARTYEEYRLINWEEPLGHAHNLYLNILAEAGIAGLVAYLGFWLVVFRLTWITRHHPDASARSAAIGLLGCWTYIAVHSVFDNLFVNNLFLHIGVLLSILAILHRQVTGSLKLE